MSESGYLRQPALSGDTIAFVCDDDIWTVSASGGVARRLTAGLGEPSTPSFSADGKWIAFVGRDEQHPEVYLMPSEGGPARRMTWLGPDVMVRGWTPQGDIVFVTTHGQPFFRNYRAFTLSPGGGLPTMLALGQVNHLAFGPDNIRVIGRNTADPARWKRYRGGTAGHLWIDAEGSGIFRRMTELTGNITSPMLIGGRVWFLSDAEGVGNLYSCKYDGTNQWRHTDHDGFYARHASTDGKRIVYQCGAEIWVFDPATDATSRVAIDVPAHRTQAARKFSQVENHLAGFNVHPNGHSLAIESRGKFFSFALWEGAVHQHGAPDGVRYRHGQWLHDGATRIVVSDAAGDERVQVFGPDAGSDRTMEWNIGRVLQMRSSPKANRVAIANHRNEVIIGDLDSGQMTVVDHSDAGRTEELAWSPDGEWLAYTFWASPRHCAIKLHRVSTSTSTLVTEPSFRDYSPAFDPDGRYLYFLSVRTFDPVYDAVQFELSFPRAARPYLIALRDDSPPPFDPAPRGMRGEGERIKDAIHDEPETAGALRIDLDGIQRRVAAFPVREERYGQIAGARNDKVVWTVQPILGAHGRGGHKEPHGKLELFDFKMMKTETILERVDQFLLADDHVTLIIRDGKRLRALPAEKPDDERALKSDTPSRQSGWIDLNRVRLSVSPRSEWRQMFREVWRLQRDQFWVADMSGIDWDAIYKQYEPLLDKVSTRAELSDLIWEMQGELGTSHAYEMGGDHRKPPQVALGQLAADLKPLPQGADEGNGYTIDHIVGGDPWDSIADSPLNAVGVNARPGDRIVAVNGLRVTREMPPQALLVHQASNKVELTLASASGKSRNVVVTTLADEVPARYREWVEKNRSWVHEHSNNRVGYLHLPDMMSAGFAEFHRYFSVECDRDALIVDVRYNRGGHVSELLLEKVARKRIGYNQQRWGPPQPYPVESPAGAVVGLTNEHSGSDGDIFSHCFKLMKIGTLVGTRTWGGVIGIWPRHSLVDGSETTQPEFSFWFTDVGWQVENYGTDPEVPVDNAPQDAATGNDRQLEKAVGIALGQLDAKGSQQPWPPFGPKPVLARGPLPARGK